MHIIIVGGGIAGLSSAIALRQTNANHTVTILESTQQNREVGATISLQPNASKIVEQQWGLGPALEARGAMIDRGFAIYGVDGQLQMRLPLSTMEKYGAERVMHHRQDLHECLKEKAVGDEDEFGGKAAVLRTGCKVVDCDAIQGTVTLESGEVLKGDLIVGADGIKSAVRKAVLGGSHREGDSVAQRTGYSAYRFMLSVDELVKEKDFSNVIDPRSPQTTMVVGHDRRLIMGPARDASVFGVVALIPDAILKESSDDASWVTRGSSEKMLEAFDVFPEWTKVMLRQAKEAGLWQLRDLDPLPTWYRGRAIVIGDAAHAMLPTQGQGASQAVEDAEALGAYFADLNGDAAPSLEEVERRNKMVFESRYERASTIQAYSRQAVKPVQTTAKVAMNPGEFMDYNCSYKGAVDWVRSHKPSSTAEVLRRFVAIAQ